MVSIKDIARALSVSPSSVSLVLNGKAREKRISAALEEKITAVARQMGYQPNRAAVSLRTGKSKTIGLIVENISNHFFSCLAHTVQEDARRFHYNVVYCSTENDAQKGKEILRLLYHQQVDGYMITPAEGMEEEIDALLKRGKPVVLVDRWFPGMKVPYVMVDNYKGMRQGMEHLFKKGARTVGFVTVSLQLLQMQERERAYKESLKSHRIKFDGNRVLRLPYNTAKETAVAQISRFLKSNKDLEAVAFATNYLGIYGLLSIKELGLRIPDDLKILCFDDHDIFELYRPGITAVQQPINEIAETAINILVADLGHQKRRRKNRFLIAPKLIVRAST